MSKRSEGTSKRETLDRTQRWVAIVGAVSALLGTAVGGASTTYVARSTQRQDMEQARREERREAYATYYGNAAEYVAQIGVASVTIQQALASRPINRRVITAALAGLDERRVTLFRDQAYIVLAGVSEVFNAAFDLSTTIGKAHNELTATKIDRTAVQNVLDELAKKLSAFAFEARRDLAETRD